MKPHAELETVQSEDRASRSRPYAEALKNGEPVPWQVVKNRKGKSSKGIIRGTLANASSVMAAVRTTDLFTSWWRPNMTSEEVQNFLKNSHSISAECKEIPTRAIKYKCFKIRVKLTADIDLFNPDLWPAGVTVSKFHNRSRGAGANVISRQRRHSNNR